MNLRDVKGKRIIGVRQTHWNVREGVYTHWVWDIECLVLDDGTEIHPLTVETDFGQYAHEFVVRKPWNKTTTTTTKGGK